MEKRVYEIMFLTFTIIILSLSLVSALSFSDFFNFFKKIFTRQEPVYAPVNNETIPKPVEIPLPGFNIREFPIRGINLRDIFINNI